MVDLAERNRLVLEAVPMVRRLVARMRLGVMSPEDAEQAAMVGVTIAADRYDHRGHWLHWAKLYARKALFDAIRTDRIVPIPESSYRRGEGFPEVYGLGDDVDLLACPERSPEAQAERSEEARAALPEDERSRAIAVMWSEGYTLREIGRRVGLSHERVRTLLAATVDAAR